MFVADCIFSVTSCHVLGQIALLDSPTALSMEEKLHQNEARVSPTTSSHRWLNCSNSR